MATSKNMIEDAATAPSLVGDFARVALAIKKSLDVEFPTGAKVDRIEADIVDRRCVVRIQISIDATSQPPAAVDPKAK